VSTTPGPADTAAFASLACCSDPPPQGHDDAEITSLQLMSCGEFLPGAEDD